MAYKQKVYSGNGATKGYKYAVGEKQVNSSYDPTRGSATYGGYGKNGSTGGANYVSPTAPKATNTSSSGSSSSGGSSSSSASTNNAAASGYVGNWSANDLIDDYMDYLNRQAESAYNKNMGIINDYYDTAAENLQKNYDESVGTLDRNNARNTSAINADAEAAMRQAYINNMLSRRNLQQSMTAQGLNGGATETTRASMENNYGNARNNIDTTRNKNLADLMTQYQNNLAGLRQQLNTGLSDLDTTRMNYSMQVNEALQNALDNYADKIYSYMKDYQDWYNDPERNKTGDEVMSRIKNLVNFEKGIQGWGENLNKYSLDGTAGLNSVANSYANALQNIAGNSGNFAMNPAEAENVYDPVSMQQAGMYANSNYARALAAQEALGATNPQARNAALSQYSNISSLQEILRQLGYM